MEAKKAIGNFEVEAQRRVIERVRALIARAASDAEEEARTSAVQACRLMREHGLLVAWSDAAETIAKHEEAKVKVAKMYADCKARRGCP